RVGASRQLFGVGQAVVVAVQVEKVGEPVVVAVHRQAGVGAPRLGAIGDPVAVRVVVQMIWDAVAVHVGLALTGVRDAISIGIGAAPLDHGIRSVATVGSSTV